MLIKYIWIRRDLVRTHWFFLSLFLDHNLSFAHRISIPTWSNWFIYQCSFFNLRLNIFHVTIIVAVIISCLSLSKSSCWQWFWKSYIMTMLIYSPLKLTSFYFKSLHHLLTKITKLLLIGLQRLVIIFLTFPSCYLLVMYSFINHSSMLLNKISYLLVLLCFTCSPVGSKVLI